MLDKLESEERRLNLASARLQRHDMPLEDGHRSSRPAYAPYGYAGYGDDQ
jgi:hypothetical protein